MVELRPQQDYGYKVQQKIAFEPAGKTVVYFITIYKSCIVNVHYISKIYNIPMDVYTCIYLFFLFFLRAGC